MLLVWKNLNTKIFLPSSSFFIKPAAVPNSLENHDCIILSSVPKYNQV